MNWYILINGKEEGPYSLNQLKRDRRITPDTLARKEGDEEWRPIKDIQELKSLFEDVEPPKEEKKEPELRGEVLVSGAVNPGPFYDLLILILIASLLWLIFQTFR